MRIPSKRSLLVTAMALASLSAFASAAMPVFDQASTVTAEGNLATVVVFSDATGQLRELDSSSERGRALPAKDHISSVRVSASARFVAALAASEASGQEQRLYMIDRETLDVHEIDLAAEDIFTELVWSPVNDTVAVVGTTSLLVDSAGTVVARSASHRSQREGFSELNSGGYSWSADGTGFVVSVNNAYVVLSTSGVVTEILKDAIPASSGQSISVRGWAGNLPVVEVEGSYFGLSAHEGRASLVAVHELTLDKYDRVERERQAKQSVAASGSGAGRIAWSHLSADANTVIGLVTEGGDSPETLVVLRLVDGASARIQGIQHDGARGMWVVDVAAVR